MTIFVIVLALFGLLDSGYFSLLYYKRARRIGLLVPDAGDTGESTCRSVLDTSQAAVLKIPNSVFGLVYYAVVLATSIYSLLFANWPLLALLTAASLAAALMSFYLAWELLFRLKMPCPLCFAAHIINWMLAAVFVSLLL